MCIFLQKVFNTEEEMVKYHLVQFLVNTCSLWLSWRLFFRDLGCAFELYKSSYLHPWHVLACLPFPNKGQFLHVVVEVTSIFSATEVKLG